MTYPELSDVRKTLRVDWYRCPTPPGLLRQLSRRSDVQGWYLAGGHLALVVFTGSLSIYFWAQELWPAFLLALFCHGTVTAFIRGNSTHELGHGTVFKTKRLNKFFLYSLQPDRLVGSLRLCQQPYLPSSLHSAPGRRPGSAAAGGTIAGLDLYAAALHHQLADAAGPHLRQGRLHLYRDPHNNGGLRS